jgi:hypothetical protein
VDAGIEVQIPKNLPDGKYTHLASVKIGEQEYKKEQQVLIVSSGNGVKIYALNTN